MKQQIALLADAVNLSQGWKLNVLGEFNVIFTEQVPVTYPLLWFAAKMECGMSDFGHHDVLLRIVDGNGDTVLPPLTGTLDLPAPPNYGGDFLYWPVMLQVGNATFPDFGTYTFELWVDTATVAQAPLYVRALQQATGV